MYNMGAGFLSSHALQSESQSQNVYGSVKTINHPSPRLFHNGMDPTEERLLLALMGGGLALIGCLTLLVLCCRKYKLSRPGMRQAKWSQHGQMLMMQQQQQQHYYYQPHQLPMHYPGLYYPSQFYQTAVAGGITLADQPRMLNPGRMPQCFVNSAAATSSTEATATGAACQRNSADRQSLPAPSQQQSESGGTYVKNNTSGSSSGVGGGGSQRRQHNWPLISSSEVV